MPASAARHAFLLAAVSWGTLLTLITEALSAASRITTGWLAAAWLVAAVAITYAYARRSTSVGAPRLQWNRAWWPAAGMVPIVACVGLIALVAPPNNYDSMTYHMSRVVHWIQNGSVAHYPTHVLRQLHQAPWAEYAIMHLQALSGGDRLANLVQWFSFIGCIVGTSAIAAEMGVGSRGQMLSAVFAATLPMAILQASSTQNDLTAAFWLVCFVYFAVRAATSGRGASWTDVLALGASLGLAVLTKATAYVFAFPFAVWLGIRYVRRVRGGGRIVWLHLAAAGAIALALNAGFFVRNARLYGSPLGPGRESERGHRYANEDFSSGAVTSNVLRNVSLHVGTVGRLNESLESAVLALHRGIGVDPNDPRTTWPDTPFSVPSRSNHEGNAGNPLHFLLAGVVLAAVLVGAFVPITPGAGWRPYSGAVVLAFLLFCALLKWQPGHSRLQLPLFVLSAPLAGMALASVRRAWVGTATAVVLLVASIPWVTANATRSLVASGLGLFSPTPTSVWGSSRTELYFTGGPGLLEPYRRMAAMVKSADCADVGLITGGDDLEYPIWALLSETRRRVRIEHVLVTNQSARLSARPRFERFTPCAILAITPSAPASATVGGVTFGRTWGDGRHAVLMPRALTRESR